MALCYFYDWDYFHVCAFCCLFYFSDTLEKVYDVKDLKKGLFLSIPLIGLCLASYITGKIIKENKVLMKWITFGGSILLAVSIATLSFSKSQWFMITLFVLSGIGIGVGLPLSGCTYYIRN